MSRRYGRKQRREARARIEYLETASEVVTGMLTREARRRRETQNERDFLLDRMRYWDSEIRSLLGPYTSFAIDDTTFRVDHPDQIRQMPVLPQAPSFMFAGLEAQETVAYYIETMFGFMCGLEEDYLRELRKLLTVRVQCGSYPIGQDAYYALSESMWNTLKREGPTSPGLERMAWRIAQDIVRLLATPKKKTDPRADWMGP